MKRVVLESVDSTNNYAEIIAQKTYGNYLIIANSQTNGRGQFDRKWFSESGKSITLSFLLRNKKDNKELKKSIIKQIPYTISSVLNKLYSINSEVVLPNDIKIDNKKLCGLLIETYFKANKLDYIIIGIGINLNNDVFPDDITNNATSIKKETKKEQKASILIDRLEEIMEGLYE